MWNSLHVAGGCAPEEAVCQKKPYPNLQRDAGSVVLQR